MSSEAENQEWPRWIRNNFFTIIVFVALIAFTIWNRSSDFDDIERQCLAKESSQSTNNPQYHCSCVRTRLSRELGYMAYAPGIRLFARPSDDEIENMLKDAWRACF